LSDHVDTPESMDDRPALDRRPRVSILELMLLVAAAAVSFRWPGLSVPVGLLFLYALTQRRDILGQPTRVSLAQVALVLYLPPAAGLFLVPREEWGYYLENFSVMPTFIPWGLILASMYWWFRFHSPLFQVAIVALWTITPVALILGLGVARRDLNWRIVCLSLTAAMILLMLPWWFGSPQNKAAIEAVVLSMSPTFALIVGLGVVARRDRASRIACLSLAAVMSAASSSLTWGVLHAGA
jgi:hypothetical protein